MASSRPIPPSKPATGRDFASSLASSFGASSPFAQEILARDIAECSDEEDEEAIQDRFQDDDSGSDSDSADGPTLYRQPVGIAFGYRRGSLLPERVEEPVLTRIEKKQSRNAERSLLRDNHLLPPKHAKEEKPGLLTSVYKRLFSTKVRRVAEDEETPGATETSPLLSGGAAGDPSPDHGHLNQQWEAAVASGKIQTTWQREAKTIAVYSRSLIVTFLLQYSINVASIFAVGRIGSVELGAVSRKLSACTE